MTDHPTPRPGWTDEPARPGADPGRTGDGRARPWPLRPQWLVALVGGVIGATLIAWENGRRLRLARAGRVRILAAGVLGLAAVVATGLLVPPGGRDLLVARVVAHGLGLLAFLPQWDAQRAAVRARARAGARPGRLLVPGVLAALLGVVLQTGILAVLLLPGTPG